MKYKIQYDPYNDLVVIKFIDAIKNTEFPHIQLNLEWDKVRQFSADLQNFLKEHDKPSNETDCKI